MNKYCRRCGSGNKPLHKHHLINGNGKRKACETEHSVIDLCWECHHWVHNTEHGRKWWMLKRAELQRKYFEMGLSEDRVRELMGGKLILKFGVIYGAGQRAGLDEGDVGHKEAVE
jgi:hypothetical protein